ncbi:MAG: glycosyltransferase family 1 protein [Methylobacter sp.]|nr:MAG: glycosyltransferase family 1 protein [Methylobacter sp.]
MRKKIIVVAVSSWYIFNFRLNLILHLKAQGYDVIAVAPIDSYSMRFEAQGIPYVPIAVDEKGTNPIKDGLLIVRFVQLFLKLKPDCILSYTPKCNIYASLVAGGLGIPIINNISGLGSAFIRENLTTKIVEWLYTVSLRKSAKVFFQNQDDSSLFIARRLVKPVRTEILPGSGVEVNRFTPASTTTAKSHFVFLMVGRMLSYKGVAEFVAASRLLKQQYPDIQCQLLGFLDCKNSSAITTAQMQEWVDEGIVEYLGVSDCVVKFLRNADCVVLPSYYREGVPRSLLEAASVGKPIITTDTVGCRDVVDEGVNGFLCKPRNVGDLKAKMEKMLLLSQPERLQMGLNGREKILKNFDEKIVIERYMKALEYLQNPPA